MERSSRTVIANLLSFIPDKQYLQMRFFLSLKKRLNLKNPQTYNEKIQWMKLYDRNPLYTKLVDKEKVKEYVESLKICNLNIIPTIAVWEKADDIDFSILPDEFVLKCTHDSGSVLVFRKKDDYSIEYVKKHFSDAMKRKQYIAGREWAYKDLIPKIIAEPFMMDDSGFGLKDYKFFCFEGNVKALCIATDRFRKDTDLKLDFYDESFKHLDLKRGHYENAAVTPRKPEKFDNMKRIAEELSKGLRQVRVDLYDINGQIYFGEFTFYHSCGFVPFKPEKWDYTFGSWFKI